MPTAALELPLLNKGKRFFLRRGEIFIKTVIKYIQPYKKLMLFALIAKSLAAFSELAIPRMMAVIIDEDVPSGDISRVLVSGAIMLTLAALTLVFNIVGNRTAARASSLTAYDLREALFKKTLNLDMASADKYGLPSLTSRLTSDTYNITAFMARLLRMGIKAPLMLIGGTVITFTIDRRLALILTTILPLVCITVYIVTKKSIPLYKAEQSTLDSLVRRVDETHSGIRVIKALSKSEYECRRFSKTSARLSEKEISAGKLTCATKPINDFLFYLGFCLAVLLGAYLAKYYNFDAVGRLLAFMTYFTVILNHMIMMTRVFVQASRALASAERIEEVLCEEESVLHKTLPKVADSDYIVFDNVTFSYNKKALNIDRVSFGIGEGQTLGIIGATGSGKTTLVKLLLRFYDPDSGSIRIGGEDIRSVARDELHSMFGVAFQDDFVFSGTVGQNIAFFRPSDEDKLRSAVGISESCDFIDLNADGVQRRVTTGGKDISGGQKQRLTVARAVFDSPRIVILDDASSALDYKTDARLRASLKKNVHATTVIIAQRIASVKDADKIIVMDGGRIADEGTHAELLEKSRLYREIAAVQTGGFQ